MQIMAKDSSFCGRKNFWGALRKKIGISFGLIFLMYSSPEFCEAIASEIVIDDSVIDFRRAVGTPNPETQTIFSSYSKPNEIFYVLPNEVDVVRDGTEPLSLQMRRDLRGNITGSTLRLSIRFKYDEKSIAQVLDAVKVTYPAAVIIRPYVINGSIMMAFPNAGFSSALSQPVAGTSDKAIPLQFELNAIATRSLRQIFSHRYAVGTIHFYYGVRGRDVFSGADEGFVSRNLLAGGHLYGFCWTHPGSLISDALVVEGCEPARFERRMISNVQRQLRRVLGIDDLLVDGIFGPITRGAIEQFQLSVGLPVDGLPDQPLLARLVATKP
jgi:hypothetical protein